MDQEDDSEAFYDIQKDLLAMNVALMNAVGVIAEALIRQKLLSKSDLDRMFDKMTVPFESRESDDSENPIIAKIIAKNDALFSHLRNLQVD